MSALPTLFISHGAPTTVLSGTPAHHFMKTLHDLVPAAGIRAILVVSAHWETDQPMLGAAARPETIHDFYGFPQPLYELRYPAPGDPALAADIADLLNAAGFKAATDPRQGLDHGAWTPLLLGFPEANIPVLQLSVQPHRDPAHHYALGQALRPLRDQGVLVLASGSLTHNLRELDRRGPQAPVLPWASAFADWVNAALTERRDEDMVAYRAKAPEARRNHPTDEHFLPLFVALGAATPGLPAEALHRSMEFGSLSMDSYRFA